MAHTESGTTMSDAEVVDIMTDMTARLDQTAGAVRTNRQTMIDLASRLITLAQAGHPELADSVMEVPASRYTDPARYEAERHAIFDRMPFVAGLSRDVAEPGDYLRIDHMGTPIMVTRNRQGQIRAFVNACRHRGAALVYDDRGHSRAGFSCPYHAWSYDLDGHLLGVSCNASFGNPDKASLGLIPVAAHERHGLILVAPKPGVTIDWDHFIGPELDAELPHWGFDTVAASRVGPIELNGNWKLVLETFLESYHFNYAHRDNLAQYYNGNVNTVDMLGRHLRTATSLRTIQTDLPALPQDQWTPENYIHVKYVLFPGTILINTPQVLEFFQIMPLGVDRTLVRHGCYSRMDLTNPANAALFERIWESAHTVVQKQDFPYGVTTPHPALTSAALPGLVFGRNEWPLQILAQEIDRAVAEAPAPATT
ncbi:aromatic ring-hydroxylating dioxygenase subunit alpha [Novosphingobium sp.]|uniref:aromatic ring-hydroxylating oxygenase subunit alpha n=1 Tax=Novosphingobium sp. TaxID=1874826 RepID=UPI003342408E